LLDRRSARVHQPVFLLARVLLAEVLLFGVLLVAEEEMMLVVSQLLEKREMIPPGSATLEEEALLFSDASLVFWYSWSLFSSVGWTGGHRKSYLWSLPICQYADTTMKFYECKCNRVLMMF